MSRECEVPFEFRSRDEVTRMVHLLIVLLPAYELDLSPVALVLVLVRHHHPIAVVLLLLPVAHLVRRENAREWD